MNYELIGQNNFLEPIQTILNNRGIEDIDKFLNLDNSVINHWSKLKNINDAVECLLQHIKRGDKLYCQVDSDPDGVTSSAILINYLKKNFPKADIHWRMHEGKQHGVIVDEVPDDIDLVLIPDAGSNQYNEHKQLRDKGIDVIVLDHHEASKESEYAIIVNNQLSPDFPNKSLSGAAIVYKFLQALDEKLNINHADYYLDLVSLGLISDMMDSRVLETRYYMLKGLAQINNSFLKALFDKQSYSTKGVINIINTQFYITPLVNAAIRIGSQKDKEMMMKAFLESDEKVYYERKDEYQPIQTFMARKLTNLKAKQNRERDKAVKLIKERIKEKKLDLNKVMIVNITEILNKNLTGLTGNQLAKLYKRPVLLVREKEDEEGVFGGSARGYDRGYIKNLKEFLANTGKFEMCEGHANAHGIEIKAENLIEVNKLINEQLKDVEIDTDTYEVDFVIPSNQLNEKFIKEIYKLRDLWGFKVEEPSIVITDMKVNKDEINLIGKKKNTVKWKHKNIEYIKFKYSEDEFNEMFNEECSYVIDVVGKCSLNEYMGNAIPQIIMEDFEVKEKKKKELIF